MTPTNPDNTYPFIYRILDSLGIAHLVVPVNHTHSESEVTNLTSDLAGKMPKVTSPTAGNFPKLKADGTLEDSGTKAADFAPFNELNNGSNDSYIRMYGTGVELMGNELLIIARKIVSGTINYLTASVTYDNMPNLQRAIADPDSVPTQNSDKLITSGAVKAAIDAILAQIPVAQIFNIIEQGGATTEWEIAPWISGTITVSTPYALQLITGHPVSLGIYGKGYNTGPDGGYVGDTDISVSFTAGQRKVLDIYSLLLAQLLSDYPDSNIDAVSDIKFCVTAADTIMNDTACVFNVYTPTSNE